ncbi:MAG: TatD family hydrolase [Gemmatimonadaceae bacterium]
MATFIDSHAHLADPSFADDVDGAIERARSTGARAVVCIGASLDAADAAARLVGRHPGFLFHTAGVHPHDAADFDAERDIPALRAHLDAGAVAVGECGLDYHYDNSPRERQREAFSAQIRLAAEARRPVVVHTRDAEDDTSMMLAEAASLGVVGVLHCFTGTTTLAGRALDAGWYVSFSGIVTFRSWTDDALLRFVPEDRLLVESDSPYLAPVPHRGRRNEPAWVSLTLAHLAAVRDTSAVALGEITAANTERLFGLATTGPE